MERKILMSCFELFQYSHRNTLQKINLSKNSFIKSMTYKKTGWKCSEHACNWKSNQEQSVKILQIF